MGFSTCLSSLIPLWSDRTLGVTSVPLHLIRCDLEPNMFSEFSVVSKALCGGPLPTPFLAGAHQSQVETSEQGPAESHSSRAPNPRQQLNGS